MTSASRSILRFKSLHSIAAATASFGFKGNKLGILIYHRVLRSNDWIRPHEPSVTAFDWQVSVLKKAFHILPLDQAIRHLASGRLPHRAVSITFDDGYLDNLENAVPVLKRHGASATFFISTGYDNSRSMWNDVILDAIRDTRRTVLNLPEYELPCLGLESYEQRLRAAESVIAKIKYKPWLEREAIALRISSILNTEIATDLMMKQDDLKRMSQSGMLLGAHTVNHPILTSLSDSELEAEVLRSKQYLEEIVDNPVTMFAYPNGKPGRDFKIEQRSLIEKLGFDLAVTTQWGCASPSTDPFMLPRFTPWDATPDRFALRLARNYLSPQ